MRRRVKASVAVGVVLGLGGWFAEPYAQDWWLVGEACGGVLPGAVVERLVPEDAHLADESARQVERLGSYSCELTAEGDDGDADPFLEATAYTRRDDQDREFMTVFEDSGWSPVAALPEGMPGFVDHSGAVRLLLPCPDLGNDVAGRPRTLLVTTELSWDAKAEAAPHDAYEVAAAFADAASDRLGCGAEPVRVPEPDDEPLNLTEVEDGLESVPVPKAKDTACGWLAGAGMPDDTSWRVAVRSNGSLPVSRCDVRAVGQGQERPPDMTFFGWYGDWSGRLRISASYGVRARATARCHGEAAYFRLSANDEARTVGDATMRQLFEAFVHAEARRHECSHVKVAE